VNIDLRGVDVVRMAEDDGVQLRGNPNGTLYGACPKCSGDDRFAVIVNARAGVQLWRCRHCHANGYRLPPNGDPKNEMQNAIGYLWHMRGLDEWRDVFDQLRGYGYAGSRANPSSALPIRKIAKPITREGFTIPDSLESPPNEEWQDAATIHAKACMERLWSSAGSRALEYLRTARRLDDATIRKFQIGFCDRTDKARGEWRGITIPRSYGGALWAINVRTSAQNGMPKYVQRTGSRTRAPLNGDALADPTITRVVICEGEFDALLCQQHAPSGTAAITFGGKGTPPNYEALLLLRGRKCFCAFDADEPGDAGAAAWQRIAKRVRVPIGNDVTEYVQLGGDLKSWISTLDGDDSIFFVQEAIRAAARLGMVATWQNEK